MPPTSSAWLGYRWACSTRGCGREGKSSDGTRGGLLESTRWIKGYKRLTELAAGLPPSTRLGHVSDRKSDLPALLVRARELDHAADYLLRCQRVDIEHECG